MMEPTSPIDCNIAFSTVQSCSTLHTTTSTDTAKLEKAVEDRTIIADVEAALLFLEVLHVVWGDSL